MVSSTEIPKAILKTNIVDGFRAYSTLEAMYLEEGALVPPLTKEGNLIKENQQEISDGVIPPNLFILSLNREEPIIIIDEEGFKYKGELIEDGGEIYKLLKEFLQKSQIIKSKVALSSP